MYRNPKRLLPCLLFLTCLTVPGLASSDPLGDTVQTARNFMDQGQYRQALPYFQEALQALEAQPSSNVRASLINETAVVHFHLGQLSEAESLYRDAILMYQISEPRDRAGLATALNNLAALHHRKRDFESAEPLYQQALTLRREALGPDHPNVAFSLNELATLYHSQKRLTEAAELYEQSLRIEEKRLGQDALELAPRLTNLAVLYRLEGLFNRAEPLFRRALDIQRKHLGERHPDVAVAINNLGVLFSVMGRFEEAEALYQEALTIQQGIFGERHISIAMGLRNLAILYDRQGNREMRARTVDKISGILDENCGGERAAALNAEDRAVCANALAMQRQLQGRLAQQGQGRGSVSTTTTTSVPPPVAPPPSQDAASSEAPPPRTSAAAAPAPPPTTARPAPSAATPTPGDKTYRAQVQSHQDRGRAERDLKTLSEVHAEVLEGIQGHVQRVDLGAKGIWFRVQFGDFANAGEAKRLCRDLNYDGLTSCWVAEVNP